MQRSNSTTACLRGRLLLDIEFQFKDGTPGLLTRINLFHSKIDPLDSHVEYVQGNKSYLIENPHELVTCKCAFRNCNCDTIRLSRHVIFFKKKPDDLIKNTLIIIAQEIKKKLKLLANILTKERNFDELIFHPPLPNIPRDPKEMTLRHLVDTYHWCDKLLEDFQNKNVPKRLPNRTASPI